LLLSLEHYDEEEETATKADIFFRRTVSRIEEPNRAEAPDQALALSIQWKGRVDPDYMARLLRAAPQAVIRDLSDRGMVYKNPETECYETADADLSGDVKRKLSVAVAAGPEFVGNVTALEKVIPEDLPPASIEPRLGAVWIPAEVVEAFRSRSSSSPTSAFAISRSRALGRSSTTTGPCATTSPVPRSTALRA
jgi:N12 class adenine-specific DNA methylase